MSVVIIVKVSEGLVLGADSASTIHGRMDGPTGTQQGVLKTYFNARKLIQIGDFPIGVLTWGNAFIGMRTIESLVREWEYDHGWQSRKVFEDIKKGKEKDFEVKKCAQSLCKHMSKAYKEEFMVQEKQPTPVMGMIVAGYSQKGFFPEIWRFVFPNDINCTIHNQRPDMDGKPVFGAHWFGLTDAIVRLHFGRDEKVIQTISDKYQIDKKELHELLIPLQFQIPFPVMPLQDAIEYANYMLNVTIGRFRFVIGSELCGGQIEIAAITQKQFEWISRKRWSLGEKVG